MNNYELLIARLDAFIRKYYANKVVRGLLLFLAAGLAYYLLASLGEYYFYFPSWGRYTLLGIFIFLGGAALVYGVIVPLLKMQKLGKVISHESAAQIIGTHFPNVQDKLLNILQLRQGMPEARSRELIEASIEQKTRELSPIPFQNAVNMARNKRYLPYVLFPLLICVFILIAAPNIFRESAKRLFSPSVKFVPQAPFAFKLLTTKLNVPQFEDLEIRVQLEGKAIPENVLVQYNGQEVMAQRQDNHIFTHTFFKVSKPISFNFSAAGFRSESYTIKPMEKPVIKQFKVSVDYPDYTGRKDEVLDNIGDIIAPQGTTLRWVFQTEHTDEILFALGAGAGVAMPKNVGQFFYTYRFMRDTAYSVIVSNKNIDKKDTLNYSVSVIPDQFPSINVQQYNDSLTSDFVLFVGEAGDDYGVRNVSLNYTIQKTDVNGSPVGSAKSGSLPVPIQGGTFVQFNQMFDIEQLKLQAGDKLSYYFSACDNDGVNGSKCAKSVIFSYEKPTAKKLDSIVEKTQEQVNKDLNAASKQNDKIDKDIKQMQENLLQKNELDWQDKKNMEEMMNRNENLQKQIENIKKKFEDNNKKSEEKNYSEDIKEKQENMEKLLDELKNKQLEERMKKMEELMKLLNKDKLFEKLKEMEQDNQLMEKDLDRMVELMKQLERDMRLEDLAKKAEDLAKKQEELAKQTENKELSNEELKKKQDALNKEMQELKKEMKEMEKVNEQMENKLKTDDIEKDQKDAEENMENSSSELSSGDSKKSSKSQKKAQKSLEDMAKKMKDAAGGGGADQLEIDIKATRQILQNLIRMSFAQEDLIGNVQKTSLADPKYVSNIQTQQKLKTDSKMIADSLFMLSKRLSMLASTVNKEIDAINRNMESAINGLEMRQVPQAMSNQQFVMMGANNLALMLNELLQSLMDQQAQGDKEGNGSCDKPGKGKKPGKKPGKGVGMQLSDIISKQQKLGGAMQQLMDKMAKEGKQGQKPGEGKQGQKPGEGKPGGQQGQSGQGGQSDQGGGESEQMARIAAEQSALRKQLNDINNELKKEGKSNQQLAKIQQDMDRNETDIVNKRITQDLLRRQSEILTRLLEAKDAMRQQDQGDQRESNSGKEMTREIPQQLKDILKNKQSVIDYYKTVPAELKPYYKQMVEDYFQLIK
ncbi:MAG: DUF4175 family protein [Chitinophagaceae bacterium]|nr:DUF4175 family protein [Chitinophagaceae bacterium]